MTTATATASAPAVAPVRPARVAIGLGAAAVTAMVVNTLIAIAVTAVDPGTEPIGLVPAAYLVASLLGVLIAAAGWAVVRRVASRPGALLRVLVPAALVLTWLPDVAVLAGGATVANAVGLMLMHTVVASSATVALSRVLPVRSGER